MELGQHLVRVAEVSSGATLSAAGDCFVFLCHAEQHPIGVDTRRVAVGPEELEGVAADRDVVHDDHIVGNVCDVDDSLTGGFLYASCATTLQAQVAVREGVLATA